VSYGLPKVELVLTNDHVDEIKALPHYRSPQKGESCWLPTRLYIDHGWDDFHGGKATITGVDIDWLCANPFNRLTITTAESERSHNWLVLMEEEESNRASYGDEPAYPDPEYHPL